MLTLIVSFYEVVHVLKFRHRFGEAADCVGPLMLSADQLRSQANGCGPVEQAAQIGNGAQNLRVRHSQIWKGGIIPGTWFAARGFPWRIIRIVPRGPCSHPIHSWVCARLADCLVPRVSWGMHCIASERGNNHTMNPHIHLRLNVQQVCLNVTTSYFIQESPFVLGIRKGEKAHLPRCSFRQCWLPT
jgi:hypothetical protein